MHNFSVEARKTRNMNGHNILLSDIASPTHAVLAKDMLLLLSPSGSGGGFVSQLRAGAQSKPRPDVSDVPEAVPTNFRDPKLALRLERLNERITNLRAIRIKPLPCHYVMEHKVVGANTPREPAQI